MSQPAAIGPLTDRRVLKIALPIVLSNATVPLVGVVDTGVVGQLGQAAPIGAVGIGAVIITFLYWAFGFLRMGTAGLAAQALGARDMDEMTALLIRGVAIGLAAGLGFILLQVPLFELAFLAAPATAEVEALSRDYLAIRIWGGPATIALYAVTGWLIAAERTREVLVLQLWINGLNITLDLVFVLGLDWGVSGVAAATIVAEWTGLMLGLWMCRAALFSPAARDWGLLTDRARIKNMMSVNGDIMIRSVLLEFGFGLFLFWSSSFDEVTLAANQILLQFMMIAAYAMDGFAFAAEALIGQALGARDRATLRRGAILSSKWGLITTLLVALGFLIFGVMVINAMTTSEEVRAAAYGYLFWMVIIPPLGCPSWMLDGIFIGATRGRDMRIAMIQSVIVYVIAVFALTALFGNHGLWAALLIFFMARGVTLGLRYPALEAAADQKP